MKRIITLTLTLLLAATCAFAAKQKTYTVASPDKQVSATVTVGEDGILYTVQRGENQLLAPSKISMTLSDGIVYGLAGDKVRKVRSQSGSAVKDAILYKKAQVVDNYNQIVLEFSAPMTMA